MNVFKYTHYKDYLLADIARKKSVRGYQTKLANAAKCHRSYFSQLLRGKYHLNPEQAMRLAVFWGFTTAETQYFVELVHWERADYPPLKEMIKKRLQQLRTAEDDLAKRYAQPETTQSFDAAPYYASWHMAALHILAGIPEYQTVAAMAARLHLPENMVESALNLLAKMGLVASRGASWRLTTANIHLPRDSAMTAVNHGNWRQRAVMACQRPGDNGLHYTAVQSHQAADFERIRDLLLETIDRQRALVAPSRDEEATCLCLDFFRI